MSSFRIRGRVFLGAVATVVAMSSCTDTSEVPTAAGDSPGLQYAKGGSTAGPTVSLATPAYGERGETGKPVTISGSGFSVGASVTWERNGAVDPSITVHSAVVVSSTRIDATISIASEAELSFYDIGVTNLDRKKGVGTEMFEVTTAISIGTLGGNTQANAANDNLSGARVVGYSFISNSQRAFYWPGTNGQMADLGAGQATGISQDGLTIAGISGGYAVVWSFAGGAWTRTTLPVSAGIIGSRAEFLVSAPTGAAIIIAGAEQVKAAKGNGTVHRPRLWKYDGARWVLDSLDLPPGTNGEPNSRAIAANSSGQAVGTGGFWDVDGRWTKLPGPAGDGARALSEDGTLIAGFTDAPSSVGSGSGTIAAYWTRANNGDGTFGPWTGPFSLPGSCARAIGLDINKRIVGHRCPNSANRYVSAVWVPPYDAASMITLRGFGNRSDAGTVWATSPGGSLLAGLAPSGTISIGAIWDGGLF